MHGINAMKIPSCTEKLHYPKTTDLWLDTMPIYVEQYV